jgi:AraC-like DNA-binding protein
MLHLFAGPAMASGKAGTMRYATSAVTPLNRGSYWRNAISTAYFPLDLTYRDEAAFSGELDCWSLGNVSLSRLECEAILYKRHERQIVAEREKHFLITIPERNGVSFKQSNREVKCAPGGFVIERSDEPYEFWHGEPNALWVLKFPSSALRARVGPPERFAALTFDATQGVGACFVDVVRSTAKRLGEMDARTHEVIGQHFTDLLCLAIQSDDRVLDSHLGAVRAAHLFRAEQFIRSNLRRSDLTPQQIADSCGISLRYLQRLFADSGRSMCEWVREQRLLMCDEELRKINAPQTISEIAYRWGFADQSQFSKHYRAQFGRSASEARVWYRMNRSATGAE